MAKSPGSPRARAFDAVLTVLLLVITGGVVVFGAIGYPFEIAFRGRDRPRGDVFWDSFERGEPVWFVDHIVWFVVAAFLFAVVAVFASRVLPVRRRIAERLLTATIIVMALVSAAAFATLVVFWIAGIPASDNRHFADGSMYVLPVVVTGITTVLFAGLAVIGWRVRATRR